MIYELPTTPGEILEELIETRNMTQKELATRIESSEKHISNIINAKVSLTYDMAQKLEFVFSDYPASLWNNLETRYREAIIQNAYILDMDDIELKSISEDFYFKELYPKEKNRKEKAIKVLKLLGLSNFNSFDKVYGNYQVAFFNDRGDLKAQTLWLRRTENEILLQNDLILKPFSMKTFKNGIKKISELYYLEEKEEILEEIRLFLNSLGVYFTFTSNIRNSKVRGALTYFDNHPVIHMTDRYRRHDHFWFALIHEFGHIINDDVKTIIEIDGYNNEIEDRANKYSRNFILSDYVYEEFIERGEFTYQSIRLFAKKNRIHPGMVLGRLQHDKLSDYTKMKELFQRI